MALAPLLVALALALAPGKMLLFGRLSGSKIRFQTLTQLCSEHVRDTLQESATQNCKTTLYWWSGYDGIECNEINQVLERIFGTPYCCA